VRESLPEEAVLSSGAVELMRQMKQQQEANASAGGNLLGNVGSTMAMASIMQLMTSRKPAPAPVSAPVSTPAPAPAPVKMADTAKREPGSGTAANGAAQGTETERFLSLFPLAILFTQKETISHRLLQVVAQRMTQLDEKVDHLLSHINTRFDRLEKRLEVLETQQLPRQQQQQQHAPDREERVDLPTGTASADDPTDLGILDLD